MGDGWNLVFNSECDIWGTQHRAEADVGEIPLQHNTLVEPQQAFLVQLEKSADNQTATLRIAWGEHEWTTDVKMDTATSIST